MINDGPFLVLESPCDQAVDWVIDRLDKVGLLVLRTFDLQSARQAQAWCPCPYHGTERCDCQMMVLLVYQPHKAPLAIIAHGNDQQTWFSFVDTPQQRADPHLESYIRDLAAPQTMNLDLPENDAQSK